MSSIMSSNFSSALTRSLLALALAGSAALAHANTVYHASINTTTMSGAGWLDFAFLPGQVPATGATVTLSNFSGAFGATFSLEGDASGSLPTSFVLGNTTQYNDLFHAVTLGGLFGFDVSFSGAYANTPGNVGTTLGVGLLNGEQSAYLGNPDGNLFQFDLLPMQGNTPGSVSWTVLAGDVASISVSAVPEPSAYLLLLAGLGVVGVLAQRRRQTAL